MPNERYAAESSGLNGSFPAVVQLELRGYLAAIEEGWPILEVEDPVPAAFFILKIGLAIRLLMGSMLGRIAGGPYPSVLRLLACRELGRWAGHVSASNSAYGLDGNRLSFARYLHEHGRLRG